MQLPYGTTVAIADGEKLVLLQTKVTKPNCNSSPPPDVRVISFNAGSGGHPSSAGNHDDGQQNEDNFSAGVAAALNQQVLESEIKNLVVIASPRGGSRWSRWCSRT